MRFRASCLSPPETSRAPPPVIVQRRRRSTSLSWGCRPLQRIQPRRVAPYRLGRPPHALAVAGLGFGVFRDEVLRSSESLSSASREVRLPFRVLRGAPPAGFRRWPRELALTVRVRLSWGSSPLRRMRSRCHPLPRPARPAAGDEGCHALVGAAHGLSQPPGGSGHDAPLEHKLPHTRSRRRLPRNSTALFHAASALGVFPTELSPLEEPCRLPAALCSLAGSASTVTPARRPQSCRDRFPSLRRPLAEPTLLRARTRRGGRDASSSDR